MLVNSISRLFEAFSNNSPCTKKAVPKHSQRDESDNCKGNYNLFNCQDKICVRHCPINKYLLGGVGKQEGWDYLEQYWKSGDWELLMDIINFNSH